MEPHYQHLYQPSLHHFVLKHPDERVIHLWLQDMTQLVNVSQNVEWNEPVLILIEHDGRHSSVSTRYIIDRWIDWVSRTPRQKGAHVCVVTNASLIVSVLDRVLRAFSGRDQIRIMRLDQIDEAKAWLLAHLVSQSSK